MTFNFLTDLTSEEIIKARYFNDGKVQNDVIAKDIISSMHLITIIDNEEILYYEDGIYKHSGSKKVKEVLMRFMGKYLKKYHISEIIMQIQGRTYISRDNINTDANLIHMNNGIYNLESGELNDFDPMIYATNKIPVDYDSNATCPKVETFLSDVLTEEDKKIIYELFGYVLFRGYPFQYAFMFIGGGSNGKSVLINLFKAFVGKNNVSNISLQDIGGDRFAGSELFDKMVNLYPDLSDEGLKSTGVFKALTGGDGIDVQRKFQTRFHLVNQAKLIFSCNKLPKTSDDTDAFFRRWIITNFPNKFTGKNADRFLIDKLTTPDELSGLFNCAVNELSRIIKEGDFSHSETTEKTKERYIRLSNPLRAFILDCIDAEPEGCITKEYFYIAYRKYCVSEGVIPQGKRAIGTALPGFMDVMESKVTTEYGRKEAWMGIGFKDNCEWGNNDMVIKESKKKDVEKEPAESGSLDDYSDNKELTQAERHLLIRKVMLKHKDGLYFDELMDEIDGRMTEEQAEHSINHFSEGGQIIKVGDIIQWIGV